MRKIALPDYARHHLQQQVSLALEEDLGSGDLTAQLIDAETIAEATVITREEAVLCGMDWANAVFEQLGGNVSIEWQHEDGDLLAPGDVICILRGNAREILTGERTALNFIQTLSGTATTAHAFARAVAGKPVTVLDTRKTLPGLRGPQKYAVLCGGCENHRIGLYDAFLIKENHIAACGSISAAIERARALAPDRKVIVEVEDLAQLDEALAQSPDQIMLDNFSADMVLEAARRTGDRCDLEISGGISLEDLAALSIPPGTRVYVSSGSLTKHVRAIDLSMRINNPA